MDVRWPVPMLHADTPGGGEREGHKCMIAVRCRCLHCGNYQAEGVGNGWQI